ncbi:hypothetical protein V8B97DRAFT_1923469 [Scleroderma yunnanense]
MPTLLICHYPTNTQLKRHSNIVDPADIHIPSHQVVVYSRIICLMNPSSLYSFY